MALKKLDKTFIYEYDGIGNITSVKKYAYTTGDVGTTPQSTDTYVYDGNIKDRLITFNGTSISYDSMGCPTYYNNKTYTWDRGKLTRIHRGYAQQPGSLYENCVFTYDAYGRRLSKSYTYDPNPASTSDYSYTYNTTYDYDNSGRLIREYCVENYISGATTTREFVYLYDETGIIGVMYNYNGNGSQAYYYRRNLQGDVIAIYDQTGSRKAEYAYDAWGNCKVTNSTLYDLAYNNPIRYRGYYYDRETGMYYLNARYYNPQWRRFISPDDTGYLDPESVNGLNLYTYCNNDPVNYADHSGHIAFSAILISMAIGFGVGAAIGGAFEIGKQVVSNGWNASEWDWLQIARSTLGGGVAGAISAIPIPGTGFLSYLGTFAIGGIASTLGGLVSGSVVSWGSAAFAFGLGGVANVCGRGLSDAIKHFKVGKQVNAISARARSIANMSAKKKSLTIWNMLGTDKFMRNAYKGWGYDQIFELLMSQPAAELAMFTVNNLTRYMVYSSVTSSILSGWY